jgi:hypothetical protein
MFGLYCTVCTVFTVYFSNVSEGSIIVATELIPIANMQRTTMTRLLIVRLVTAALLFGSSFSLLPVSHHLHRFTPLYANGVRQDDNFLLQEFRLHNGEVLNPYSVLKVPRNAELSEIKTTYRQLSRRYHPDIMRHKDILPGSWYVQVRFFFVYCPWLMVFFLHA